MKRLSALMGVSFLSAFAIGARQQPPTQAASILNRMTGAYRSIETYYDVATIKRRLGEKDAPVTLTLAMLKPSRYLMELKGDFMNTVVMSDGNTLTSIRPDKKAYARTKAPLQVLKAGYLTGIDIPSPGAKIITALLESNIRDTELGGLMANAKVTGPHAFGSKQAYILNFPYGQDLEARVYVTTDDYLIRQIKIMKDGDAVLNEVHDNIELDKPIAAEKFTRTIPEGMKMVASLPSLDKPGAVSSEGWGNAPDFTVQKVKGGTFTLSSLKGKVVLLNFFFDG